MDHQTSAIIFTNFYVLYFAARVYWAGKAGKRPVQKNKSFFLDRLNIGLVGIFTMIVPLLAVYTHWLDQFDYLENSTLIFLSIPFLLGGLIVFWKSHQDLAENWSVTLELKENHTLITNGIFKYVRHPMYLAFWLSVIGQAQCNWTGSLHPQLHRWFWRYRGLGNLVFRANRKRRADDG